MLLYNDCDTSAVPTYGRKTRKDHRRRNQVIKSTNVEEVYGASKGSHGEFPLSCHSPPVVWVGRVLSRKSQYSEKMSSLKFQICLVSLNFSRTTKNPFKFPCKTVDSPFVKTKSFSRLTLGPCFKVVFLFILTY